MQDWLRRLFVWAFGPDPGPGRDDKPIVFEKPDPVPPQEPPRETPKVSTYSVDEFDWLEGPNVERFDGVIPHKSSGRNICDFLIAHYTGATGDHKSSIRWAADSRSKVSWHIGISRSGEIMQLLDFRTVAWHAGRSKWIDQKGRVHNSLNRISVGIELSNAGPLRWSFGEDAFISGHGQKIPEERVFSDGDGGFWEAFPEIQQQTFRDVALALCERYKMLDVLGHNQIAPGRKQDPGPAAQEMMDNVRLELYSSPWFRHERPTVHET